MMIEFCIEPVVGPLPLRFGMTPNEVASVIGPPEEVFRIFFRNLSESRTHVNLGYSPENFLDEVIFLPGAQLFFRGHDLFNHPDLIGLLRGMTPVVKLMVGFLIFPELGLGLSGYHNCEDGKAIRHYVKDKLEKGIEAWEPYP